MVGPVKTRLACDRCHGHKLRCPKQAGSRVCGRCERAGVACIFSPIGGSAGNFRNGNTNANANMNGASPAFPTPSLFNSATDGMDLGMNNGDWHMPGNNIGTPGFSFDELMHMATSDGPVFTGDATNLFAGMAGMSPGGTPGMMATTAAPTAVNSADSADQPSNGNSPKDGQNTNISAETTLSQRLSKLVADTDLLYCALPSEATLHAPLNAINEEESTAPFLSYLDRTHYSPAKFAKKEFLERVFDITQRLSTAYADAAPKKVAGGHRLEDDHNTEKTCDSDNCLHSVTLPGNLSTLEAAFLASSVSAKTKKTGSSSEIDLTVASLLVAAHTRLLDVLVRIVHGLFACYRLRVATSTLDEAEMQLPDLTIGGSFVPPKGSAALVHAFLLRHLLDSLQSGVERYWARLKENEGNGEGSNDTLAGRERHIASLQFGALKERHDTTLHHLVAVGTDLATTGLIK